MRQPRAWKLAGLGLLILALGMSGWDTSALAARARSHRHVAPPPTTHRTTHRTTSSKKSTSVTRNPLAPLKFSVERKAQKGRAFTRDVFERSTEGGTITAWIYQGKLQKLSLHLFGETGHHRNTYYVQGKWTFCVVRERWIYNRPISTITSRSLKMAKVKHEEYYLATNLGLYRASPKSKLTKLSTARRKTAERLLTQECADASRIFKTHPKSTTAKKVTPSKKSVPSKKITPSKKVAPSKSQKRTKSKRTTGQSGKTLASAAARRR